MPTRSKAPSRSYNREAVPSAAEWIDAQMRVMWAKQQPDGIIEGWHGDGNFARTSLMYALWKTQGVTARPWRPDLRFGAAGENGGLCLHVAAGAPWNGRLVFDSPRHKLHMKLPLDYPRINQFPEWFTVEAAQNYVIRDSRKQETTTMSGKQLAEGLPIEVAMSESVCLRIEPQSTPPR